MRLFRFEAVLHTLSLAILLMAGCTPKDEPVDHNGNKDVAVTEVTLEPASVSLSVGGTATLTATVKPSDAKDKTVAWSSSNTSVATVENGTVTAVAEGSATVTATAGGKSATCSVTVTKAQEDVLKAALMKFYNALDGPHWNTTKKWDPSTPLSQWEGIEWNKETGELKLALYPGNFGLKGEIPDCFDDLTPLSQFFIQNESGVTGTLPSSFAKLKKLKNLTLAYTSMTSLPDFFEGMPLEEVFISGNSLMSCPLPASLASSPSLKRLMLFDNPFTGTVPDSYARLGSRLQLYGDSLDERVPDSFVSSKDAAYLVNMYLNQADGRTTPLQVGDYDIPAFWPPEGVRDLVTNKTIKEQEIYSKNKVTVQLNWGTWCPYSKELMPVLKRMYDKYHKDGLEIIAALNATSEENDGGPDKLKGILRERGYDQWYNFNLWGLDAFNWNIWCAGGTPSAVLVDSKGNIITSSLKNVADPARNRFGYTASSNLIPLLESIFGPLEEGDDYASSDYTQDGKVITIQKASTGKGINLVFMGDAYTDKDMASGLYERMMRACAEEFFRIEPYKSFKNRFNVYAVKVVSKNGRTGTGYTTALGASMVNGSAVTGNRDKVFEYALKVSGIKDKKNLVVGVLVNSIYHGGITDLNESLQSGIAYYSSMGNDPSVFGPTLRHETGGHGFAFLGDEYSNQNGSPTQAVIDETNRLYKAYGWYANIDFTSDPSKVKWNDFISDSRYKDEVGVYQGGLNLTNGVYRPSVNSMMNQNMEYFNAPSRWAIYKRIMELSGETASFAKFLEYDAVNRGANPI